MIRSYQVLGFLLAVFSFPAFAVEWTGCYVGINAGGASIENQAYDDATALPASDDTASGFAGGVQAGCDIQMNRLVFGVQGMADKSSVEGDSPFIGSDTMTNVTQFKLHDFATLTGRAGYAINERHLPFLKTGLAWGRFKFTDMDPAPISFPDPYTGSASWTAVGWLWGGGYEFRLTEHVSLSAEYAYVNFGKKSSIVDYSDTGPLPYFFEQDVQQFLVGMNYRF